MRYLILVACVAASCSCSVTFHPDGRRVVKANPELFFQSLQIIAEK